MINALRSISRDLDRVIGHIPAPIKGISAKRTVAAIHWRVITPINNYILFWRAMFHRKRLKNVTFIGVTGSAGKTLLKELIAAILSTQGNCRKTPRSINKPPIIARTILTTRPKDRYCILELAAAKPGYLDQSLRLASLQIGAVTVVGRDHFTAFRSEEAVAAEKSKLIASLPANGIAVLNADDPHVMEMSKKCRGQVLTFGTSSKAILRAENVFSAWPHPLSFRIRYGKDIFEVKTRLHGKHMVVPVLAALGVGVVAGIQLERSVQIIKTVAPFRNRMSSLECDDGVTFLMDAYKAPLWSMRTAFDFMKTAHASRKILIIGTISDYPGSASRAYSKMAKQSVHVADHIFFVGSQASHGLIANHGSEKGELRAFGNLRNLNEYLVNFLKRGDLVFLKGSHVADHLMRIALARTREVKCWRSDCRKELPCNWCTLLETPEKHDPSISQKTKEAAALHSPQISDTKKSQNSISTSSEMQIIVGLGNPGLKYDNTPHNIGYRIIDSLAQSLGFSWSSDYNGQIAHGDWKGLQVYLFKSDDWINNTGTVLTALAKRLGFNSHNCILLQDDMALPLGKVRVRMSGSDGGHQGIRSILLSFQTSNIRRVKVGVQREAQTTLNKKHLVIRPFKKEEVKIIEQACALAVQQTLKLLESSTIMKH